MPAIKVDKLKIADILTNSYFFFFFFLNLGAQGPCFGMQTLGQVMWNLVL